MKLDFKEKSPADFFSENMDVCGFDNPIRAIYTAVRELLENSLDACEAADVLPKVNLEIRKEGEGIYVIRIEDNGPGIPPEHVPESFGKIFYSSKYVMKQQRGRFGMGGTMAVMYGQITTQRPVHIVSMTEKQIADLKIKIDIIRNSPITEPENIWKAVKPNDTGKQGTTIELTLEGNYQRAREKILEYIKQTAMIAPYAEISFTEPDGSKHLYKREVEYLPPIPKEAKPHPRGVNLELFRRLMAKDPRSKVSNFLVKAFQSIGRKTSLEVLGKADVNPDKRVNKLGSEEIRRIVKSLRKHKGFRPPDASSLAPMGEEMFEAGIKRVLKSEFVKCIQRPPKAYEGNPFIVEVAIAYGGEIKVKEGEIKLYRFANRIPLLYDEWNDVSTRVLKRINWKRYGVKPGDPFAVFVHICSTNIPYKTLGKEYIANKPEIRREIYMGVLQVAREMRNYLNKLERKKKTEKALKTFMKYAETLTSLLSEAVEGINQDEIKGKLREIIVERLKVNEQ